MNTDSSAALELAKSIAGASDGVAGEQVDVAVIPPFVYIQSVVGALSNTHIAVGAQDVYFEAKGAFTGEISVGMLKDIGCSYVLCGHSERRHVIGETDELVNKKVTAAINGGLLPILCVGEKLDERQSNKTNQVVKSQVEKGLAGLHIEKARGVTIAYEPVWAIGTGLNATPQQAQEVHQMIRELIAKMYDKSLADEMRIQYGGSANAANAQELLSQKDVDGLLVGGASLKAADFVTMIKAGTNKK